MSQGIVALIKENKRRFYAGEIRNSFYEEPYLIRGKKQSTIVVNEATQERDQTSLWQNLKTFGQKIGEDLFYESA